MRRWLVTYNISLELSAVIADTLENFLDLAEVADVEDWFGQVDVTEMSWTFLMTFTASLTLVVPVERTKARIRETTDSWLARFIFDLGDLDLANRDSSLIK